MALWSNDAVVKNSATWRKKTKAPQNARSEKLPPGKISKPPIHQEHTKTQNSTKVADTTNK